MVVLSLFDGMAGARLALDRAGIHVDKYYASEINPYAMAVVKKNYKDIIHLGDICNWKHWGLPPIDLIIGGSPCQGFSIAGKRLNFKDPRSVLFFKFFNILKAYKPRAFIFENVRMEESIKQYISALLKTEPIEINSYLLSAQCRKRIYWTNIPNVVQPEDKKLLIKDILDNPIVKPRLYTYNRSSYKVKETYSKTIVTGYLNEVNSLTYVYSVFGKSPALLGLGGGNRGPAGFFIKVDNYNARKNTITESERLQTYPVHYSNGVSYTQRRKMLGESFTVDVIAHILKELKDIKL